MTDHYEPRASTHADDCWSWGPGHYKCAVGKIERMRAENERLRVALYELRERCAQECERLASSQCNTSIGEAWELGALACADEIRAMTLAKENE